MHNDSHLYFIPHSFIYIILTTHVDLMALDITSNLFNLSLTMKNLQVIHKYDVYSKSNP